MKKYSVLMSVYQKEKPEYLETSISSMLNQTVPAEEFLIVKDGPLTEELNQVIEDYQKRYPHLFTIISLEENGGLGPALAIGVERCRNQLIVRMDSDDVSLCDRCEKQLKFLEENPEYDIVGTLVNEFTGDTGCIVAEVKLPKEHMDIIRFAKTRNPFRHCAVIYKKQAVLEAGNYRDFYLYEDYDIFVRMLLKGAKAYNIQEPLVLMRVSEEFYARRGGAKYLKSILRLRREHYKLHFTNTGQYLFASAANTIVCFMPNGMRDKFYKKFLRNREI